MPTREGYAGLTRNNIKLKTLLFTNALASSSSSGCPSGYVCDGTNANGSYDRSLGSNLANDGTVNRYLTFKPAMEVIPSKTWNDLTDGTWHELKLTFKNNSTNHSFSPSKYGFDFRYETYLGNFADLSIKGDLGTHTGLGEGTLNKISFFMTSGLPVVEKSSSVDKVISLRANSHGIGFGKIGFSGFLPYILENNAICNGTNCSSPLATTGYNTQNIGLNSGIMSFDYQSSPIPSNEFGNSQSYAQKFAASGQIANSAKNRIQAIESGVAIETGTMDKTQFKTNVNKNVEAITRSIASDNGTNCSVTLTSVEKELYYYDFTKLTGAAINGNKGCVLTLR
ncbi:MAG: hypothetical protein QG650_534 [Patescibacteria group bacterium]|nr:hypothetical protein [Patescibacteria group bacterium]